MVVHGTRHTSQEAKVPTVIDPMNTLLECNLEKETVVHSTLPPCFIDEFYILVNIFHLVFVDKINTS